MHKTCLAFACLLSPAIAAAGLPQLTAEECVVWQREQDFARSVVEHDAEAFSEHVHEHAVFDAGSPEPVRGRAAIVERWKDLIEGKRVALRWYPTRVTIASGVDGIARSSGPSLLEVLDPEARDRYLVGTFNSVWRKQADGTWRVLFDDGAEPRPATAEDVAAFHAGRADCAASGS